MESTQNQMVSEEQTLSKKERRILRREEKNVERERRNQRKTWKRTSMWALVVIVLGGALYGMGSMISNTPSATPQGNASLLAAISGVDRMKGATESSVTLIEYSDFQCPACGLYFPLVEQLMSEYGDRINFVYRHFPLPQHQHAKLAAYAAEAAGVQGKFWEMYVKLFENQEAWTKLGNAREEFTSYAESLGLDMVKFEADLDSTVIKEKVNIDMQGAITLGVNSTPTFYLNGIKIQNPRNYDEFKLFVDNTLASNS